MLPFDAVKVVDPLIAAEAVYPSPEARDAGVKLTGYFRILSLRHYIVAAADIGTLIQHSRQGNGAIMTASSMQVFSLWIDLSIRSG